MDLHLNSHLKMFFPALRAMNACQEQLIQRDNIACWREKRAEVEFVCEDNGSVIPVEVKSGWVTQSKSLGVFTKKYSPPYSAVFSARNMGVNETVKRHYYPLYLASKFPIAL